MEILYSSGLGLWSGLVMKLGFGDALLSLALRNIGVRRDNSAEWEKSGVYHHSPTWGMKT